MVVSRRHGGRRRRGHGPRWRCCRRGRRCLRRRCRGGRGRRDGRSAVPRVGVCGGRGRGGRHAVPCMRIRGRASRRGRHSMPCVGVGGPSLTRLLALTGVTAIGARLRRSVRPVSLVLFMPTAHGCRGREHHRIEAGPEDAGASGRCGTDLRRVRRGNVDVGARARGEGGRGTARGHDGREESRSHDQPQRFAGIWMPSRERSAALATSATVPAGCWYQPGSLS